MVKFPAVTIECLIDRLGVHLHSAGARELQPQAPADLLRRPFQKPARFSGMIALDQTGEDVIVEAFFSARGNTGGFSNRNEYFYVCARLAGVPGEPQVTAEAMSCPGWAVEQLADSTWIEIDLDEVLRG